MNRAAVRSGLGRCRAKINQPSTRSLSTTPWRRDDSPPRPQPNSRERLAAAASQLSSLGRPNPLRKTAVDARSLGASAPGRGPAAGPNMVNLRSLKGPLATPRTGRFAAGGAAGAARFGNPRLRRSGPGTPGAGGNRRPGAGGQRTRPRRKPKNDNGMGNDAYSKVTWTPEEQEWFNRIEQGSVTPYTPLVNLKSLTGHGPALATDATLGKIESAMRSMRIVGGGKPFCPDGYFNDPKDSLKRYHHEKKPVFFDSLEERAWLERAQDGARISPPKESTKAAIIQAAVQGKYVAPRSAVLDDPMAVLASYHARDPTYLPVDEAEFDAKVRSLLPAQGAGGKRTGTAKRAA